MPPAASKAPPELVAGPPWMSSAISWVVHHSVVATSSAISVTESVRTRSRTPIDLAGVADHHGDEQETLHERHAPARAGDEAVAAGGSS